MVVTEADPQMRIVTEINGEPAGKEYARLIGLDEEALSPMCFATFPVVVKIGGKEHVRSIQKVNEDGSLTFFCAIDVGVVLTVAQGVDILENLKHLLAEIGRDNRSLFYYCATRYSSHRSDRIHRADALKLLFCRRRSAVARSFLSRESSQTGNYREKPPRAYSWGSNDRTGDRFKRD